MAPSKTPVGLIQNMGKRRKTFKGRREGLLSAADTLARRCGVPVAVVCADLDGGAPTVKETGPGVLDRYRALPAETRAKHTHLRYIEGLLGNENAKIARVREVGPRALAPPHEDMSRMTLDELRGMLERVDAALAAAAERRRTLGLPGDVDAAVVPCGDSGPSTAGCSECDGGYFHPMQQGQGQGLGGQPMIGQALQAHGGGMMPREHHYGGMDMVQPAYDDTQPQYNIGNGGVHLGGYQQQMPGNDGYYHERLAPGVCFQPHNAIAQPWNGALQYDDGGSSHVGTSSSWMQGPSNGNFNNGAVHLGGYQQKMPINGGGGYYRERLAPGACFQPHDATAQPWNGVFQYDDGGSSHVGTISSWMQGPSNGNFNNGAVHDLAIWSPAESGSGNAFAVYPYMYTAATDVTQLRPSTPITSPATTASPTQC